MKKNALIILISFTLFLSGCAMMQSIVKSTFPYTTTLVIPRSSQVGTDLSVTAMATSFDQDFTRDGNNGRNVSEVRVVSARLQSKEPSDFNIGNLLSVHVYMARADGKDEVMVASRTDITAGAGNNIVLDIDNAHFLDQLVREAHVRIRMVYRLRDHMNADAHLHLVLGLGAYPGN